MRAVSRTVQLGGQFPLVFAVELHQQNSPRVAFDEADLAGKLERTPGQAEHHVVDQLDGRRSKGQNRFAGPDRIDDIGEVDRHQRHRPGPGFDPHLGPMGHRERAFGANHDLGKVELAVSHELVQVVAGDPAHETRESGFDFLPVQFHDVGDAAVQAAAPPRFLDTGFLEQPPFAGGQHRVDFHHVIDCFPVKNRMRTGGVVAHHSADGGAVGRRSIGTEEEAHRFQVAVELFLNHAGLDPCPTFFGVHFKNAIQVFGTVDDDRMTDGLSGETGSATPGQHGRAELTRHFHCRENVFGSAGNDHAYRHDFVDAGVGAV